MLYAYNIRVETHLVDIKCGRCGTIQADVNANTELTYVINDEGKEYIHVPCTNANCNPPYQPDFTDFPTTGGDDMAQQLAAAKTE